MSTEDFENESKAGAPGQSEKLSFWKWFDIEAAPKLAHREVSFRKIFEYLDRQADPIIIVETGCVRSADSWEGDGQSTCLFDRYVRARSNGAHVYSVDLDLNATTACKALVSDAVTLHTGDSVGYLRDLVRRFSSGQQRTDVSLFYLDSFDVEWRYPYPSAAHHLKELVAISPLLKPETLVVVDDSPIVGHFNKTDENSFQLLSFIKTGGKGFLIGEYAAQVGAQVIFSHYQVGFVGF